MKYLISIMLILCLSLSAYCQQAQSNAALRLAAARDDVVGIERTLQEGADVNATTHDGRTALMIAAFYGNQKAVHLLIEKNADLDRTAKGGKSALLYSVGLYPEITIALIKAGADVNVKDELGHTALMSETDANVKKILKDAGAKEIEWENPWAAKPKPVPSLSGTSSPAARPQLSPTNGIPAK